MCGLFGFNLTCSANIKIAICKSEYLALCEVWIQQAVVCLFNQSYSAWRAEWCLWREDLIEIKFYLLKVYYFGYKVLQLSVVIVEVNCATIRSRLGNNLWVLLTACFFPYIFILSKFPEGLDDVYVGSGQFSCDQRLPFKLFYMVSQRCGLHYNVNGASEANIWLTIFLSEVFDGVEVDGNAVAPTTWLIWVQLMWLWIV